MTRKNKVWLLLILAPALLIASRLPLSGDEEEIGPEVFEMKAFVVYAGTIDTVDGITGDDYHESNEVVEEFREDFNKILLAYHRRLLMDEMKFMKESEAIARNHVNDLNELAGSFGINKIHVTWDEFRSRERSILRRLIEDPFFKIEELVIWDLKKLKAYKEHLPENKYANQIRYNAETGQWERRVTTLWKVGYNQVSNNNRLGNYTEILKEQGLNLDTNKGYHFINRALPKWPPISAFKEVKLTYPIFINTDQSVEEEVKYLKQKFLENLVYIYDPFSWVARRNTRFRGGLVSELREEVQATRFPLTDRDWFDNVLAHFLNDVVTVKHLGIHEIYDFEMLRKVHVNKNILGVGFDLLNWKEGEERSVDYDPTSQSRINLSFNHPGSARFVLLDAYRRYPNTFIPALRDKLASLEKKRPAKDVIKEVLAEVSSIPGDRFVKNAIEAEEAELSRYRYIVSEE